MGVVNYALEILASPTVVTALLAVSKSLLSFFFTGSAKCVGKVFLFNAVLLLCVPVFFGD